MKDPVVKVLPEFPEANKNEKNKYQDPEIKYNIYEQGMFTGKINDDQSQNQCHGRNQPVFPGNPD